MKRFFILTTLLFSMFIQMPATYAVPVPAISKATIVKVGPDQAYEWIDIVNHSPVGKNTITGDSLYLYVKYTGYPQLGSEVFYQNRNVLPHKQIKIYKNVPLANSNGVVTGSMTTYQIPFSLLSSPIGQISFETKGKNGGMAGDYVVNLYRNREQ